VDPPAELPEATGVSPLHTDSATRSASWNPVALAVIGALAVFLLYQLALLIWAR